MNEARNSILRLIAVTAGGLLAAASVLFAIWMLFLVVVFFGNFRFQHFSHIGIFFETCLFIATALGAAIGYFRSPSPCRFFFVAGSACLGALTFWLWSIPAARGLIH